MSLDKFSEGLRLESGIFNIRLVLRKFVSVDVSQQKCRSINSESVIQHDGMEGRGEQREINVIKHNLQVLVDSC